MNSIEWPYLYPHNTNYQWEPSVRTRLNCSSGYESASNDSSLIESYLANPSSIVLNEEISNGMIKDDQIDIEDESTDCNDDECHQKRRVLSRSQREEANRRERHRMKILNHAYERLRNVLPFKKGRKRQKLSRMDTVIGAIEYIRSLLEELN